ncbi:OpgC domain-containing protein, partial [Bradyrhizobium sp. YR681]|uniref:OpgC domain-containing protein n=1 Tax=Bradyrhizobium sp. YR681 TaxID=1144344 RepID=UPI001F0B71F5
MPKPRRDVRLDLFRGLANWLIFLGHIPDSVLAWFTTRNYGFSDGADLFVLISGYTATFVFGSMMMERGFVIGATRLLRRVWQLYVAHLLLFLVYLTAVHYIAHSFDDLHLMDQFNVAPLMDYPVETLSQGLILKFKPLNLDVLPLYIVLMAAFPVVLWFMLRWRNAMMIGSLGLYWMARHYGF